MTRRKPAVHGEDRLLEELSGARPEDLRPEKFSAPGACDELYQASRLAVKEESFPRNEPGTTCANLLAEAPERAHG